MIKITINKAKLSKVKNEYLDIVIIQQRQFTFITQDSVTIFCIL